MLSKALKKLESGSGLRMRTTRGLSGITNIRKQLLPGAATDYWGCGRDAGIYYYGKKRWNTSGFILHNAIDVERFGFRPEVREHQRRQTGLEQCFVIGHVGRFNVQKNHSRLLDIFAAVAKDVPEARLVLIGTGEL